VVNCFLFLNRKEKRKWKKINGHQEIMIKEEQKSSVLRDNSGKQLQGVKIFEI
jgi:hypothetical protein